MKESVWGYLVIVVGIVLIFIIFFFQNVTNTDEHNMTLLKEVTEASMTEAVEWDLYKESGRVKINEAAFVECFLRRFSENAQLTSTYKIEFYKIQPEPPLVNIRVLSSEATDSVGYQGEYTLTNTINAILETDPTKPVTNIE